MKRASCNFVSLAAASSKRKGKNKKNPAFNFPC